MRGNAVGQRQKRAQPGFVFMGKVFDANPVFLAAEGGAQGDHHDVFECVQFVAGDAARVRKCGEVALG